MQLDQLPESHPSAWQSVAADPEITGCADRRHIPCVTSLRASHIRCHGIGNLAVCQVRYRWSSVCLSGFSSPLSNAKIRHRYAEANAGNRLPAARPRARQTWFALSEYFRTDHLFALLDQHWKRQALLPRFFAGSKWKSSSYWRLRRCVGSIGLAFYFRCTIWRFVGAGRNHHLFRSVLIPSTLPAHAPDAARFDAVTMPVTLIR